MSGRLTHFELTVAHPQRASEFFRSLFGWDPQPRLGGSFFFIDGSPSGGLVGAATPAPARIYFDVDDIEAAVARVRALGGSAQPIESAAGYGRWCHCRDDQGTEFGLYKKQ
jgi:predicted enzyme related to lactoylglutathione lyase